MYEMGMVGMATVTAVNPCPSLETPAAGHRYVTGTFVTYNATVLELHVEGLDEPIVTTPTHPFWSVEDDAWLPAGELEPGDLLSTAEGDAWPRWFPAKNRATFGLRFVDRVATLGWDPDSRAKRPRPCVPCDRL